MARRKQVLDFEKGPDGVWHPSDNTADRTVGTRYVRGRVGQILRGSGQFDPSVGVYRDLGTGLVGGPGEYTLPPVPGSIGRWRGKGTKSDPRHWVGVSEKVAAYGLAALVLAWAAEQVDVDVSNWWSGSVTSVEKDLTSVPQAILNAFHIPYTIDTNGRTVSVGRRQPASFWTWIVQQVMVQGADLEAATNSINTLSTGFPSGQGLSGPPPG